MAPPVINELQVVGTGVDVNGVPTIVLGESAVVTFIVSDPDARAIRLTGVSANPGDPPGTPREAILIVNEKPFEHSLSSDDPNTLIVQRPATPSVFDVTPQSLP